MNQLEKLKVWLPDVKNDALLQLALERAEQEILALRFPYDCTSDKFLEPRYMGLQLEWAIELISKMGAENEVAHSENGVSRTFENAGVSNSLKRRVIPMAKVVAMDAQSDA